MLARRDTPRPTAAELVQHVGRFVAALPFRIERVILFGSRIRGDELGHSDLDILLVSADFEGASLDQRLTRIMAYYDAWTGPCPLEIVALTPAEVETKMGYRGLVWDAVRTGVSVDLAGD